MYRLVIIFVPFLIVVNSSYSRDYEEKLPNYIEKLNKELVNKDEPEFINPITSQIDDTNSSHDDKMLCEDFEEYANNCTSQAKLHYNSTMILPLSEELENWCSALQTLVTCEYDWNMDCKDATGKFFNELIIKGQLHIFDKICDDTRFSIRYDSTLNNCIEAVSEKWKACYVNLKHHMEQLKNVTNEFNLCCAKIGFYLCTLRLLMKSSHYCTQQQSMLLQQFASIVSEGEVPQKCNYKMPYPSCPGGDPRPPLELVNNLMHENFQAFYEVYNMALRPVAISKARYMYSYGLPADVIKLQSRFHLSTEPQKWSQVVSKQAYTQMFEIRQEGLIDGANLTAQVTD